MGYKRKLIITIIVVLLMAIVLTMLYILPQKKEEDFGAKLISVLNNQNHVIVQDVFSFDFDKAFIFNDSYISGEGFAKRYNLDITINEVETGVSEAVQRIVFVDETGAFVYEYKCNIEEIILQEKGLIIYPETVIKRTSKENEKPLLITFQSLEYYSE